MSSIPPSFASQLSPEMTAEAEKLWKHLDELSNSDPKAYREFITKQLEEQKKSEELQRKREEIALESALFLPDACFAIETSISNNNQKKKNSNTDQSIYINICSSTEVSALVLKSNPAKLARGDEPIGDILIPLSLGPLRNNDSNENNNDITNNNNTNGSAAVDDENSYLIDIVFHPQTIERGERDMYFKLQLVELSFEHIEEDHGLKLHRGWKFIENIKYKGKLLPKQQKEAEKLRIQAEQRRKLRADTESIKNSTKSAEIVMPTQAELRKFEEEQKKKENSMELKEIKLTKEKSMKSSNNESITASAAEKKPKKSLIEEVDENDPDSLIRPIDHRVSPQFALTAESSNYQILIYLPEVESMNDVTVDISPSHLLLSHSHYRLDLPLTRSIISDASQAKFNKKKRTLKIIAPFKL